MVPVPVPVPEPSPEAIRFYQSGLWLWAFATLWGLALPAILVWSRFGAWAQRRLLPRRWGEERPLLAVTAIFVLWAAALTLIDLPLSFYASFVRPHEYGLSNQTLGKWASDFALASAIGLTLGAAGVWFPYALLRRSPRRWWLWTALALLPVMAILVLVAPVVIDPLFNDFGPMRDRALEARILALADRAGIDGARVFEVRKSVDTKTVNAYVTGLLGSHRIVLWDTLLAKLEPREIEAVMAHEMAHFTLGHVERGLLLAWGFATLGLFFVDRLGRVALRRPPGREEAGGDPLAAAANLPTLALLGLLVSSLLGPFGLFWSRHIEHEADRFALELLQDNHAVASAFVKLQRENLSYPRPARWVVWLRSSHPPLGERIDFANAYRPWESGGALRYAGRFRAPAVIPSDSSTPP